MPQHAPATSCGGDITRLLASIRSGDRRALDQLFALVYGELCATARRRLGAAQAGHALSTTVLVHEVYLKLMRGAQHDWVDPQHFFAVASRAMRQIVVDDARARAAQKRHGEVVLVPFDENHLPCGVRPSDLVALDEALAELKVVCERLARVVDLRFFGGFSVEETGEAMGLSPRTVKREWRKARAFLLAALKKQGIA